MVPRDGSRGSPIDRGGSTGGERRALAIVCTVLFVTFLDNTVVGVMLGDIQASLHPGVVGLQWIVDAYMLAFAGLMLTGGTLGDLFGRKKVLLGGLSVFCAGSLVGALAPGTGVLTAGRVIMGVGAAASEPGTLSLIRHIYPDPGRRARALGVWAAVSGVALALGPIIGGVIIGASSWRGVFWFNVVLGALALVAGWRTLPENADPQGRRLDVPGLVLGALAVSAATAALIQGETVGYGTWWIAAMFAGAVVSAVGFVAVERRSPDPVLKLGFFHERPFTGSNLVAFATNFGVFAVFFFTALYLQLIANFTGYEIAVQFVAMAVAMVAAAPLAGRWVARDGPRTPMTLGCFLAGGGLFWVNALLDPNVSVLVLAWALALVGFGFGMALVTMTSTVLAVVPAERSGMASSTLNTSRELGGVFGVAVLGSMVNGTLVTHLESRLRALHIPPQFREIVIEGVTHGAVPKTAAGAPGAPRGQGALVAKVIQAAEQAFRQGLEVAMILAGAMLLAAAVVAARSGRPLRRG